MKKKSSLKKIISLSIITILCLSISTSSLAELDDPEIPAQERAAEELGLETILTTDISEEESKTEDSEAEVPEATPQSETPGTVDDLETENSEATPQSETLGIIDNIANTLTDLKDAITGSSDGETVEIPETPVPEAKPTVEPVAGDTYSEIITREDGTKVKVTYEYVLNEETGELETVVKDELEGEFDEDGNLIEKHTHNFIYTSNEDGTHTVKCEDCDMEEYIENCEFVDGICIHCGYKHPKDPILTYEDDEVIVTVKGAVPENADLKVTPIKKEIEETKDVFESVEQRLINETGLDKTDFYGFAAYDICFVDIDTKEEVEPSDDVTVSIEYKQAVITLENGDNVETSIGLIHFNEETNAVENLTEANKADIKQDSSKAVTKVEFTNDNFSTYVIQWNGSSTNRYVKLVASSYTRDNTMLSHPDNEETIHIIANGSHESENITDVIAPTYTGYRCIGVERLMDDGTYQAVDTFKYNYDSVLFGLFVTKEIETWNGNEKVGSTIELENTIEDAPSILLKFTYEKDAALTVSKKATGTAATDTTTDYEFQLLSGSTPLTGKQYLIGGTTHHTDENGKFTLKTGESADFAPSQIPAGTYKVVETGIKNSAYTLANFITKISVDGEIKQTYNAEFEGSREIAATVVNDACTYINYKNCYVVTTVDLQQPEAVSKYIRYRGNDEYELSTKFTPPAYDLTYHISEKEMSESVENMDVDIVLVIDKSGSMDEHVKSRPGWFSADITRMDHVANCVYTLRDEIRLRSGVNVNWKVVYFSTNASGDTASSDWKTTEDLTISKSTGGSTNYAAGINRAAEIINNKREGVEKTMVIFLTDGQPTYTNEYHIDDIRQAYIDAKAALRTLKCDAFYAIGVDLPTTTFNFNDPEVGNVSYNPTQMLTTLTNKQTVCTNIPETSVSGVSSEELEALFEDLAGVVTMAPSSDEDEEVKIINHAKNVRMKDTLSEYAEAKPGSEYYISLIVDGSSTWIGGETGYDPRYVSSYSNGKIPTKKADGTYNNDGLDASLVILDGGTEYTLIAHYDPASKTITVTFPSNYTLNPHYAYIATFDRIIPTDKAYDDFVENGYNATGDPETDHKDVFEENWTSENKDGFFSNVTDTNSPDIIYDYKGESNIKKWFPKPVLQVHPIYSWELYKVDDTVDGANKLGKATFKLNLRDTEGNETEKYLGVSSSSSDTKGLVSWLEGEDEVETIPQGIYTIHEEAAPTGYIKSDEYWKIDVDDLGRPTVLVCTPENADGVAYETAYADLIKAQEEYETPQYMTSRDGRNVTYRFYFKNSPMGDEYALPNTGGNGTYRMTAIGIILMLTSVFLFYMYKKRIKILH